MLCFPSTHLSSHLEAGSKRTQAQILKPMWGCRRSCPEVTGDELDVPEGALQGTGAHHRDHPMCNSMSGTFHHSPCPVL